jgi:hypothetical protein
MTSMRTMMDAVSMLCEADDWPSRTFDKVYHVGTMEVANKSGGSWEGAGLSVSLTPKLWIRYIPHLMDNVEATVWMGTRSGNHFLDFAHLGRHHFSLIIKWSEANGYLHDGSMTPLLQQRLRSENRWAGGILKGILCTVYTEDVLHMDGVWWDRDGTPARGVIVPTALVNWRFIKEGHADDR